DAMLLQLGHYFERQVSGGAGRDGDVDAERARLVDELEEILTAQRVATREDQVRRGMIEGRDLMQQILPFLGAELVRMRRRDSFCATVAAGEAAGLRHLP